MTPPSARKIKAARALLGWTMEDLAAASGLSRSVIADYERDHTGSQRKASTVAAMAEAMERVGIVFLSDGVRLDASARVAAGVRALTERQNG